MADPRIPVRYQVDVSNLANLDPILAHLCAWLSYYAYFDNAADFYSQILDPSFIQRIPADEATGRPQGWILQLPECTLVVFAGTTDYSQLYGILRDLYFRKVRYVASSCVAGSPWSRHGDDLLTDWETRLLALMQGTKVIFTGHSLGAAVAAVLCASMQAKYTTGVQPSIAIGFGCPRLGNKNLAAQTAAYHNVVIPGDVVPKLPPKGYVQPLLTSSDVNLRAVWPTDGFTKHGKLTYLGDDGGLTVLDAGEGTAAEDVGVEWDAARAFGEAFFSGVQFKNPVRLTAATVRDGIDKHYAAEYLRRLEKNIPPEPTADGTGMSKYGEVIANQLPADNAILATIDPPAYPTPAATTGVRPLTGRRRH